MSALDALEEGVRSVENDPNVFSVGSGGYHNLHGECELDAGIMCGKTLATGAVLGLRGFRNPISVARKLMEKTPHTVIAGMGADTFALEQGFVKDPVFHEKAYERWFDIRAKCMAEGRKYPTLDACTSGRYGTTGNIELDDAKKKEISGDEDKSHDTIGMLAMDKNGNIAAATSTSGLWLKIPGRIGDTPIIGSGFYADNDSGAAVGTGVGEEIMRGCMSFLATSFLAQGFTAQEAAEKAIAQLHRRLAKIRGGDHGVGKMAIVCGDRHGNVGAAANHDEFYMFYAKDNTEPRLFEAPVVR
jgi:isoaspartyl peptidase/L-asparaginase-like protein (Ntn-hydrolase superfamily)